MPESRNSVLPMRFRVNIFAMVLIVLTNACATDVDEDYGSVSATLCGHWCVFRLATLHGISTDVLQVTELMPASDGANSMQDLVECLQQLGLSAEGKKRSIEWLDESDNAVIAHLDSPNHFVVVLAVDQSSEKVQIFDTSGSRMAMRLEEFLNRYSGHVVEVNGKVPGSHAALVESSEIGPTPQFAKILADCGSMSKQDQTIPFSFPFTNQGNEPLLIRGVYAGCSCVRAEYPKNGILPGDSGVIEVFFQSGRTKGSFEQEVFVATNAKEKPSLSLFATGFIECPITTEPDVLEFGKVPAGTPAVRDLFVRFAHPHQTLRIQNVRTTVSGIELETTDDFTKAAGSDEDLCCGNSKPAGSDVSVLHLRLRPDAAVGPFHGEVIFETGIEQTPEMSVKLSGRVMSDIRVVPSVLNFGRLTERLSVEKVLSIEHSSGDEIQVERVSVAREESDVSAEFDDGRLRVSMSYEDALVSDGRFLEIVTRNQVSGSEQHFELPIFSFTATQANDLILGKDSL